ncbi:MAG: C40 family peptidase [Lewinellaceae bacterium]|nr:C40 family peptidase [Saprospiraceae bacterium]MCB9338111.1 C40 family peptidase [Lewinellaceae bacterium]
MLKRCFLQGILSCTVLVGLVSCSAFTQSADKGPLAEARTSSKKEIKVRNGIVDFSQEYVGSKYRSASKGPNSFDCSGFVHYVMKNFDIEMAGSSASQESQGKKVSKQEAQPGDLVFFRRSKGGRVFHVAIVLDNDNGDITVIHSTSGRGVVIDRLKDSAYWRSKVMSFRNVVGKAGA